VKPFIGPHIATPGDSTGGGVPLPSEPERGVARVFAQMQNSFMQIKDHVCANHRPSPGPPGGVLPLWPM
jgi:hypothetical protein